MWMIVKSFQRFDRSASIPQRDPAIVAASRYRILHIWIEIHTPHSWWIRVLYYKTIPEKNNNATCLTPSACIHFLHIAIIVISET